MKNLFGALILVTFATNSIAGPFGVEMGMSKADLGISNASQMLAEGTFKWKVESLPKNSRFFEYYIVQVTPQNGLCYLKAVGQDVSTSAYGTSLRTAFDKVNNQLQKKYSGGTNADFLRSGSIWDEPEDFMMGLQKSERVLAAYYDEEEGSTMVEGVTKAYLTANAASSDSGWVSINYVFENHDACTEELNALDASVF